MLVCLDLIRRLYYIASIYLCHFIKILFLPSHPPVNLFDISTVLSYFVNSFHIMFVLGELQRGAGHLSPLREVCALMVGGRASGARPGNLYTLRKGNTPPGERCVIHPIVIIRSWERKGKERSCLVVNVAAISKQK